MEPGVVTPLSQRALLIRLLIRLFGYACSRYPGTATAPESVTVTVTVTGYALEL